MPPAVGPMQKGQQAPALGHRSFRSRGFFETVGVPQAKGFLIQVRNALLTNLQQVYWRRSLSSRTISKRASNG